MKTQSTGILICLLFQSFFAFGQLIKNDKKIKEINYTTNDQKLKFNNGRSDIELNKPFVRVKYNSSIKLNVVNVNPFIYDVNFDGKKYDFPSDNVDSVIAYSIPDISKIIEKIDTKEKSMMLVERTSYSNIETSNYNPVLNKYKIVVSKSNYISNTVSEQYQFKEIIKESSVTTIKSNYETLLKKIFDLPAATTINTKQDFITIISDAEKKLKTAITDFNQVYIEQKIDLENKLAIDTLKYNRQKTFLTGRINKLEETIKSGKNAYSKSEFDTRAILVEALDDLNDDDLKSIIKYKNTTALIKDLKTKVDTLEKLLNSSQYNQLKKALFDLFVLTEKPLSTISSPVFIADAELMEVSISVIPRDSIDRFRFEKHEFKIPIKTYCRTSVFLSAGPYISGLGNYSYSKVTEHTSGTAYAENNGVINTDSIIGTKYYDSVKFVRNNSPKIDMGISILTNFIVKPCYNFGFGGNIGLAVNLDKNIRYLVGGTVTWGNRYKLSLHSGLALGNYTRLSEGYSENKAYKASDFTDVPTAKYFGACWYTGISINFRFQQNTRDLFGSKEGKTKS